MCVALIFTAGLSARNFTVVYLDRTEVNMEATSYIKKQIKKQKAPLKVSFTNGFSKVDRITDPVVIINSGRAAGLDPRIESFLSSQSDTSRFILVNIYRMGRKTFFSTTSVVDSSAGVDEISASSYYDDPKTDSMHQQWTAELFRRVQEKL